MLPPQLKEFQQKSASPASTVGPKKKRRVKTGNQLDTSTPDRHSPDNVSPPKHTHTPVFSSPFSYSPLSYSPLLSPLLSSPLLHLKTAFQQTGSVNVTLTSRPEVHCSTPVAVCRCGCHLSVTLALSPCSQWPTSGTQRSSSAIDHLCRGMSWWIHTHTHTNTNTNTHLCTDTHTHPLSVSEENNSIKHGLLRRWIFVSLTG